MSYERVDELMEEGWQMEHSPAQVAVYEEAVRIADTLNDTSLAVDCRMELVTAATFSGADEKAMVAFAWVLARFDEDPDCVDVYDLMWKYKWIINSVTSFPTVSLSRIRSMEDDMERRYLAAGYNLRAVHDVRADIAMETGEEERCREYFAKWKSIPRDFMADCLACEQSSEVRFMVHFGKYEDALETATPILSGEMRCSSVPETTYGHVLIPLMHLDRLDDARRYHELGYPLVAGNPDYIPTVSRHLAFMVRDGQMDAAVRCVEQHLPLLATIAMVDNRMEFYCTASALFRKLAASQTDIAVHLPETLEIAEASNQYKAVELADWFQGKADQMASQFDVRNGNRAVSEANSAWQRLALGNSC
ncbi:MAG: hypothetical protein AB8G99_07140 [Planctomycetaceae bacterium]